MSICSSTAVRTNLVASQTFQSVAILPLEQINNETIVPHPVDLPLFLGSDFWRQRLQCGLSLRGHLNSRRFMLDSVQVFVQTIQDEGEKLLRIVLIGS